MTPLSPSPTPASATRRMHTVMQADATSLPLPDRAVDLCVTSPPYCDARTYGIGAQRKCVEWVEWMVRVVKELHRVTIGPVIVIAAGVTRDRNYWPACEGLMWEWWKLGGDCQLYRPVFWHRVGIPGSGGKDWLRADVEYCMCFKRPGALPWSDNTANGHPPKWALGGSMSHRVSNGARVNQWGHPIDTGGTNGAIDDVTCGKARPSHRVIGPAEAKNIVTDYYAGESKPTRPSDDLGNHNGNNRLQRGNPKGKLCGVSRRANGISRNQEPAFKKNGGGYPLPALANPGNLVKIIVGGGVMGHPLAHENEAPFPVALATWFIKSFCPPGGTVLDPFAGSGSTGQAAEETGRNSILSDLRESQCELTRRRLATPHARKVKRSKASSETSLFAEVA